MKKKVIGIFFVLLAVVVTAISFKMSRVVLIDDANLIQTKKNAQYPVSLDIFDTVWGQATIDDSQLIIDFVNVIRTTPIMLEEDSVDRLTLDTRALNGVINFQDGTKAPFVVNKYLEYNGAMYGNELSLYKISKLKKEFLSELYSPKNLSELIKFSSKVNIDAEDKEVQLSQMHKKDLANDIQYLEKITSSTEFNEMFDEKGKVLYKVLINTNAETAFPDVYALFYENGFVAVHDQGNNTGAILYLKAENYDFIENILNEYQ